MYKSKKLFILILLLLLCGCSKVDNDIDTLTKNILTTNQKVNTVSTGYEFYLPNNIIVKEDNDYNQIFKIKNKSIYLYVDIISYHYKNELNLSNTQKYNHYYKEINYNNKKGYIGIDLLNDNYYYCKIVYNYAKVEFYTDEENMNTLLANGLMIINSIKYNDNLIKVSLNQVNSSGKEITYELNTPNSGTSTFNDYLQEYDYSQEEQELVELPDEE